MKPAFAAESDDAHSSPLVSEIEQHRLPADDHISRIMSPAVRLVKQKSVPAL